MASQRQSRFSAVAPSFMLAALMMVSACASTAPRPPAPISTGDPRVDPSPDPVEQVEIEDPEDLFEDPLEQVADGSGLVPPHMRDRAVTHAAVLLPFSHPNRSVRAEAEGLLAAIEMALFDHGDENFVILPKDTAGVQSTAEQMARTAIDEGADIFLGPLFAANVQAVRDIAAEAGAPVLAFSNDRTAAGQNAWLASIAPEDEVARVMGFARGKGVESYAYLGPDNAYGRRVERAMRLEAARLGGQVIAAGFYDPANSAPTDEAKVVADAVKAEAVRIPNRVAVLIPERGVKLRAVAPLLPYFGVDTRYVVMLGTSRWNDPSVWREPTLIGGYFPAPPPEDAANFNRDFQRVYGRAPSDLASLGYDAAAIAAALAGPDGYDRRALTNADGFRGVNGLFRFLSDGTSERGLAVMRIDSGAGAVLEDGGREDFVDDEA